VLFAAPTVAQVSFFWDECMWALDTVIAGGLVEKNLTNRTLKFWNGGWIGAKTAHNADTLRGDYADLLLLEEYPYMDPDAWEKVGAPMLIDNDGTAWFMGSPNRKNHFWKLHLKALADTTGRWFTTHVTSFENPHLSKEALAEIMLDMTEDDYQQEIMALFLEGEGSVFRNIAACLWTPTDIRKHMGHRIVAGLDWGETGDYSALSIGCVDCKVELVLDRFHGMGYPAQQRIIKAHRDRWNFELLAEENSIGLPNIQQLREDGVDVIGFTTSGQSKTQLIKGMQLALERETWKWIDNKVATGELEAYERKVTSAGNLTYSAPAGVHDDTVIGRCLMLKQAQGTSYTLA